MHPVFTSGFKWPECTDEIYYPKVIKKFNPPVPVMPETDRGSQRKLHSFCNLSFVLL